MILLGKIEFPRLLDLYMYINESILGIYNEREESIHGSKHVYSAASRDVELI